MAELALGKGFKVTVAGRDKNNLEQAEKLLPKVSTIVMDTNKIDSIQGALVSLPNIHHIFYSAGSLYAKGKLETLSDADIENFVHERILGPLFFTKYLLNHNVIKSATYISGMLGKRPKINTTLLSISCVMVDAMVQSLAIDNPTARFNSVSPGITLKGGPSQVDNSTICLSKKGHAQQVASLVLEIMTNSYINGANMNINGAQTLV